MLVLEGPGKKSELKNVSVHSEPDFHRVYFHSGDSSVLFELKKSRLGGYSYGLVTVEHLGRKHFRRVGRLEIEALRRSLMDGEEHLLVVGDLLLRLKPEAISYLFPRESYGRLVRFFLGLWELGRKIKELGSHRKV